jgi:REP element-mobilizing transposase RayT
MIGEFEKGGISMPNARKDIVKDGEEGVYHCWSRCVRRSFLCGKDSYSGNDYEHRREWLRARLEWLADSFCIEVVTFSVMQNHHHVILRTRPDLAKALSDEEVVRRRLRALPQRRDEDWNPVEPDEKEVAAVLLDEEKVELYRKQSASLSKFMAYLNENIARRSNAEDNVTGRFFEGRFKCSALLDEAAILACMAYVDLNEVRAKLADTPEGSVFSGAYDRIVARQGAEKIKALEDARLSESSQGLAPEKLTEQQQRAIDEAKRAQRKDRWLCPLDNRNASARQGGKRGLFPLSVDEYLELLDWTGRQIKAGKRGAIPAHLAPILKRLSVEVDAWLRMVESFGSLFWRVVGRVDAMLSAARAAGRRWFKGLAASRSVLGEG